MLRRRQTTVTNDTGTWVVHSTYETFPVGYMVDDPYVIDETTVVELFDGRELIDNIFYVGDYIDHAHVVERLRGGWCPYEEEWFDDDADYGDDYNDPDVYMVYPITSTLRYNESTRRLEWVGVDLRTGEEPTFTFTEQETA